MIRLIHLNVVWDGEAVIFVQYHRFDLNPAVVIRESFFKRYRQVVEGRYGVMWQAQAGLEEQLGNVQRC